MDKKADIRTSMKELFAHMDEAFFYGFGRKCTLRDA